MLDKSSIFIRVAVIAFNLLLRLYMFARCCYMLIRLLAEIIEMQYRIIFMSNLLVMCRISPYTGV